MSARNEGVTPINSPPEGGYPPCGPFRTEPRPHCTKVKSFDAAAAFILSAAVFLFAHWQGFVTPYAINDDVRQQVFWMQRFQDPDLYPPELLNTYAEAYVPSGVVYLYEAVQKIGGPDHDFTRLTSPVQFTKVLSGLLFVMQCMLCLSIGQFLGGRRMAWALTATIWLMPFFLDNISGGLARAFASPMVAYACLSLLKGQDRHGPAFISALAIPYIFLPTAPGLFLSKVLSSLHSGGGRKWLRLAWICAVFLAATFIAYLNGMKPQEGGFGPLVWLSETLGRPEFGPAGRLDLVPLPNPFLDFVYFPFERIGLFKEFGLFPGIASLVALAPLLWYGGRALNWRCLASGMKPLAVTGCVFLAFYVAARLAAFKLFVPDRYVQYPVNLLYAILLAACVAGAVKRAGASKLVAVWLILLAAGLGTVRLKNVALYDYSGGAPLYEAVEAATPKNAMIAGHPDTMDNVLTFSRRNAYATFELAHPWSKGYWERFAPRLDQLFRAYYAKDREDVVRFARESGADFLLVEQNRYTPAFLAGEPFFEPYGSRIKAMTLGQERFAVLSDPTLTRIPLTSGTYLIDLRPLKQEPQAPAVPAVSSASGLSGAPGVAGAPGVPGGVSDLSRPNGRSAYPAPQG